MDYNDNNNDFNMSENANLEVNKKNSEYYKNLMTEAGSNKDSYYNKNNPIVKIVLIILFVIIVIGSIFILFLGL